MRGSGGKGMDQRSGMGTKSGSGAGGAALGGGIEASGGDTTWSSGTEKTSPFVVWKTTCPSRRVRRVTGILRPSLRTSTSSARAGTARSSRNTTTSRNRRMALGLLGGARELEVGKPDGLPAGGAHDAVGHTQL